MSGEARSERVGDVPADEAELLSELRAALSAADPAPTALNDAARAAFTWRTVDAELAALVYDSYDDRGALAGVRGPGEVRELTFEDRGVSVELEVSESGRRRRIVGQLAPAAPGEVEVRQGGTSRRVPVDEFGRFAVDVDTGPTRLRCEVDLPDGRRTVDCDWTLL